MSEVIRRLTDVPVAEQNADMTFIVNDNNELKQVKLGGAIGGVDATLTQEGAAADAKATGDAISNLSKEIGDKIGAFEPANDDIPSIFYGRALPQSGTDTIMPIRYVSKSMDVKCYCKTKAQGSSSMAYPKKNQTTKLYADLKCAEKVKIDFKNWGAQNKFCMKANWIDLTHARNIVSTRIWNDVVRSRANYEELPELLKTSPNLGAVDGFPVKVYAAGKYQGRYTLNIPKDAWMANMDKDNPNHCILCGENYSSGCFRAEAVIDGSDWTDEVHDVVPDAIKTRWNEIITFVQTSTDEEFKLNLGNYFYVDSLIDYYLFGLSSCDLDGYGKNQLYLTYDGQRWIADVYDKDSTFGLWWTGASFVATDYARTEYQDYRDGDGNLLYIRLESLFADEIKARWAELREGALSVENIIKRFDEFVDICPPWLVAEDYADTTADGAFTGIPSRSTNNIQQIRAYAFARKAYVDTLIGTSADNLWSISDKQYAANTVYLGPTNQFPFVVGSYYLCVAHNGYVQGKDNCTLTADGEDITLTSTGTMGAYGMFVPITLEPGETYDISYNVAEGHTVVSIMYYDANKMYAKHQPLNAESETPGMFEKYIVAEDYPYAFVYAFVGGNGADITPGMTMTIKDIVIKKV